MLNQTSEQKWLHDRGKHLTGKYNPFGKYQGKYTANPQIIALHLSPFDCLKAFLLSRAIHLLLSVAGNQLPF